uniref:Fatty acid hydroxylase domain-containing protein n=1 Tax=Arcella intermedia TaxID=1963864 RepID=A0A6B2LD44_9EUKA
MLMGMSGALFYYYYVCPTYEKWVNKSNPNFPPPEKVRSEIITMCKGLLSATFCPSVALYLSQHGLSQAYCGSSDGKNTYTTGYHIFSFLLIWIGVDLWEFWYHRLGHTTAYFWKLHKPHHTFFNPSPFAVIADEWVDQFARALPLLVFPIVMPMNMDLIFFEFAAFFYLYGVYLHWGYEFTWLDAHNPYINTAFQHYCHHAVSIAFKPYHTGFFFKIWDKLAGSLYDKDCFCAKCEREAGKRSFEDWKKLEKPDYSVLLQPKFWLNPPPSQKMD